MLEALTTYDSILEAVPEFEHSRGAPIIVFLCFDPDKVTHLAQAQRGVRAAYRLSRLSMNEITELSPPISIADILNLIPQRAIRFIEPRFKDGGLLTPGGFTFVVDAIRQISSATHSILDRFSKERRLAIERLGSSVRKSLAYQKETLATALALADIDRKPLQTWNPPKDRDVSTSFLDGLSSARLREDPMVINDLSQIPGFAQVRTMNYGAAVFENDKTRLTVVLANRLPLEEQLGADLIYFNERFKSFVIVQYKAMELGNRGAVYRLPNKQLTDEIARMDSTLAVLRGCLPDDHRHGFRITDNPFFLKLCPRIVLNPDDKGLTPGMYIPLEYWRFLEKDKDMIGPKGGRTVTYQNVDRYFDNTSFVGLVANSWIGTSQSQSTVLKEIIKAVLESGKTVTIAVKITKKERDKPADEES